MKGLEGRVGREGRGEAIPTVEVRPRRPLKESPEPATLAAIFRRVKSLSKSKTGLDDSGSCFRSTCASGESVWRMNV